MRTFLGCLLCLACCSSSFAQLKTPVYRNFTLEDGMVANNVQDIAQDEEGYLWISSMKGIMKFDGKEFMLANPQKIWFRQLLPSSDQKMWFTAGQTLSYFEGNEIAKHPMMETIQPLVKGTFFQTLHATNNGDIWFSISNLKTVLDPLKRFTTLYQLTPDTLLTHDLAEDPNAHRLGPTSFWKNIEGVILHTGKSRHGIIQPEKRKVLGAHPHDPGVFEGSVTNMIRLQDGSYLATGANNLMHFDDSVTYFYGQHFFPKSHMIIDLFEDRDGTVWLSTYKGVYCIENQQFSNLDAYKHFLPNQTVTCTFQGKDGMYWFGTSSGGLFQMESRETAWIRWKEGGKKNLVRSILPDGDRIWLSSLDGHLYIMDSTLQLKQHPAPPSGSGTAILKVDDKIVTGHRWLISENGVEFLKSFEGETKVKGIGSNTHFFNRLTNANEPGTFWFSNNASGFFKVDLTQRKLIYDSRDYNYEQGVYDMITGPDNRLWAIHKWDVWRLEDSILQHPYDLYPGLEELDSAWRFHLIRFTEDGKLILTSRDSGIAVFHNKHLQLLRPGKEFRRSEMGVSNPSIENDTSFWIFNSNSFDRFGFDTEQQRFLLRQSLSPGFSSPLSSEFSGAMLHNGRILAVTNKGLVHFDPDKLVEKNQSFPPVYITSIETIDSVYSTKSSVKLPHDQNKLILQYRVVSFLDLDQLNFRYRLSGVDEDWQYSKDNRIRYTNLTPGKYVFEVESSNGKGIFQDQSTCYSFEIVPHFTQTLGFRISMLLLSVLVLLGLIYGIIRYISQQNRNQRVMTELKYQALISQMSPHFIFNAMNSISYLIKSEQSQLATRYLSRFAGLLRGVIENAKHSFVPLAEEVEHIRQYLEIEQLQMGDALQFEVEVDPDLPLFDLYIPPMLLQPAIENAINHGITPRGSGEVLIHLVDAEDSVMVAIRDNGIGREAAKAYQKTYISKKRSSIGVQNTAERIRNLNQLYHLQIQMWTDDLEEQGTPAGTQVEFRFPKLTQIPHVSPTRLRNLNGPG